MAPMIYLGQHLLIPDVLGDHILLRFLEAFGPRGARLVELALFVCSHNTYRCIRSRSPEVIRIEE